MFFPGVSTVLTLRAVRDVDLEEGLAGRDGHASPYPQGVVAYVGVHLRG